MNLGPLDLPGPQFLGLYVIALVFSHFAGKLLARLCRGQPAAPASTPALTPLESAFLAGGRARAIDAALVGMLQHHIIEAKPEGGGLALGTGSGKLLAGLQADLFREIARRSGALDKLHRLRTAALERMETRLANDGLLLVSSPAERRCTRLALSAPVAAVLLLGLAKIAIGVARSRPVVLLTLLVLVATVMLGIKFFRLPLRSSLGDAVLDDLHRRNAALQATAKRRSAELDEASLMLAVGLFGTGVLASSELLWMQKGFAPNRSSDGGSTGCGSSGGCGGGGGGGGGCGGCGG